MASELKNLSVFESPVASGKGMKIAIVVAEWNSNITGALLKGAVSLLQKQGVEESDIIVEMVPGTYELTMGAKIIAQKYSPDAIIAIGCVIKGDTPHFEYICSGVTHGINMVAVEQNIPIIFGVLTVNSLQQAEDRCGGRCGNKGDEAAATAIKMVALRNK